MKKVKSVLNFIKSILYPLKVNYQKENFNRVYTSEFQTEGISEEIYDSLSNSVKRSNSGILEVEVETYLRDLPKTIKSFLNETPYSNDKATMLNIYTSCLITLLRSITLSNNNYNKLFDKENEMRTNAEELTEGMLKDESINSPVVFHLKEDMKDYIAVLTNKIKKIVAKDIREMCQLYEPTADIIEDILMEPLSEMNKRDD